MVRDFLFQNQMKCVVGVAFSYSDSSTACIKLLFFIT